MANQKRRGRKGSRSQNPTTLILCQGTVTEDEYFKKLKRELRISSAKIKTDALDPAKLVNKAANLANREKYDETYVVIDVDESSPEQINEAIQLCKKKTTKNRAFHLVISNPSFEVWLLAHIEDFPHHQVTVERLSNKLKGKILIGNPPKHLQDSFAISSFTTALERTPHTDMNALGPNPSTSVPVLIERLQKATRNNPHHQRGLPR